MKRFSYIVVLLQLAIFPIYGQEWTIEYVPADEMVGTPDGKRYIYQSHDTIFTFYSFGYEWYLTDGHTLFMPDSRENYIRVSGKRFGAGQRKMVLPIDVGSLGAQNMETIADFGFYDNNGSLWKKDADSRVLLTDSCKIIRLPVEPRLKVKKGAFRVAEYLRKKSGYVRIRIRKTNGDMYDVSVPCLN